MPKTIRPENPEEFEKVTRVLLDLADRAKDVATTTQYETLALVVPDYLYERYQAYLDQEETVEDTEPPKRRPGRPRKAQPAPEVELEPEPEQES